MKTCRKCKAEKPTSEFGPRKEMPDGLHAQCRQCHNARYNAWRDREITKRREVEAAWRSANSRQIKERTQRWYDQNEEKQKQKRHLYFQSPEAKKLRDERTRRFRKNNPEKYEAHKKMTAAITMGKLIKLPCEVCQNPKSEGHHEDYSKPLDVIWLCRTHHMQLHANATP